MKLNVYTKSESGSIEFRGVQDWDSREDFWLDVYREDDEPEFEDLSCWPDSRVEWRRGTGLGV